MTPEGRVKAKVKKALSRLPFKYYHMPVMNGMGAPGLDYWCCINGWFVGIETKAPGKDITPRQAHTAQEVVAAGGTVFVVDDDETIETMMAHLVFMSEFKKEPGGKFYGRSDLRGEGT